MDDARRRQLAERRAALQEANALQQRLNSIRDQTDILVRHAVPHALLLDDRETVDWIKRHFPMGGGTFSPRIDWSRVPGAVPGPAAEAEDVEAARWLSRLRADHSLGDHDVIVFTGNGTNPAIRMGLVGLIAHPRVVLSGCDCWVACERGGWAIEFLRFEDGWWWGPAGDFGPQRPPADSDAEG